MTSRESFHAGPITPPGLGGISIFRLSGQRVPEVLDRIFRARGAAPLTEDQVRVGRVVDDDAPLDDVVVRTSGRGRIETAEISLHGGAWLSRRFESLLHDFGALPLPPTAVRIRSDRPEFAPSVVGEAEAALSGAVTQAQVAFFLGVVNGGLGRLVRSLHDSAAVADAEALPAVIQRTQSLRARSTFGIAFARPPRVALSGVPNAGKSSLMNALLREERVLTAPEPGTTRDVVAEPCAIDGHPFELIDTAGVRDASSSVEREGVERARRVAEIAEIRVHVLDAARGLSEQGTAEALRPAHATQVVVVVAARADLGVHPALRSDLVRAGVAALETSISVAGSIDELRRRIVRASPFGGPLTGRQPAPFTARQTAALDVALAALREGACAEACAGFRQFLEGPL